MIGLDVLPVGKGDVSLAADISRQFGLLCGDAVVVAVMQARGLSHRASKAADFDRVAGGTRTAPDRLPSNVGGRRSGAFAA